MRIADQNGCKSDACALAVGRKVARHSPDGLCNNGNGHHLEAVDQSRADRPLESGRAEGEQHQ